jgi:hypothetical protein
MANSALPEDTFHTMMAHKRPSVFPGRRSSKRY